MPSSRASPRPPSSVSLPANPVAVDAPTPSHISPATAASKVRIRCLGRIPTGQRRGRRDLSGTVTVPRRSARWGGEDLPRSSLAFARIAGEPSLSRGRRRFPGGRRCP